MSIRPRSGAASAVGEVASRTPSTAAGGTRLEQVLRTGFARRPIEQQVHTDAVEDIYNIVRENLHNAVISPPPPLVIAIANVANGLHALLKSTKAMLLDRSSNRYYATGKAIHERIKQLDTAEDVGIGYGGAWQMGVDEHWMKATWNQWAQSPERPRYDKLVSIVLVARFFAETYIENSDEQIVYLLSEDIKSNALSHEVKWIESAKDSDKALFEMGSTGIKGVIDKGKITYEQLGGKDRETYVKALRDKAGGRPIEILITGNNPKWVALNAGGMRAFTQEGRSVMENFVGEEENIRFVPISQTTEGFYERRQALKMVMPAYGRAVTVLGYGGETGQVTTSATDCVLYGSLGQKQEIKQLVKLAEDTYKAEFDAL
jgi:hypothetical protein